MNISYFMNEAHKEAKKALKNSEVPIGGLLVNNEDESIISRKHNQINNFNNAIYHCEILLILDACKKLKTKYLNNTTLFITLEPCTMCSAAISEVHISRVYFSAYDTKNNGLENFLKLNIKNDIFVPDVYGGINEFQNSILIKNFFKSKRK